MSNKKHNSLLVKIKHLLVCLSSVLFCSCQSSEPGATMVNGILHIDFSEKFPENWSYFSNDGPAIVEYEFIPLETTKDVIIGDEIHRFHYVSEEYIIFRGTNGDIYIFNRNGRVMSHFNHRGGGPEEYNNIKIVVIDENNEEIFIFDGVTRIIVYSFHGQYKRTFSYSDEFYIQEAFDFDDNTMLVYCRKGVNFNESYSKKPYMLMSKLDGSITDTLNIYLPVRYSTSVTYDWTDDSGTRFRQNSYFFIGNNRHFGRDFIISDVSSDTIYLLSKNRKMTPLIVRTPSVHSTDPKLVVTHGFSTDKFICLNVTTLDYQSLYDVKPITNRTMMIDLETLEISIVGMLTIHGVILENTKAMSIFPDELKSYYEVKQNTGRRFTRIPEGLMEMAPLLGEEDNPIVYLTKFK